MVLSTPKNIDEYIAFDGYKALGKVLTEMTPEQVIETIKASGLRMRWLRIPDRYEVGFHRKGTGRPKICCL